MVKAMVKKVLLFPAMLLESVRIKVLAAEMGEVVIAAATEPDEAGLALFSDRRILPHVTDASFAEALKMLLVAEEISHIYSPHERCYHAMSVVLAQAGLTVTLSNGMQQFHAALVHDGLRAVAAPLHAHYAQRVMMRPIMPLDDLVAFLHVITPIAGQSHFLKLATLGALSADFPVGDFVEIGVAAGRSAIFLALLMRYHQLGVLVAIDPWINAEIKQNINSLDSKMLVDNSVWDRGVNTLITNILPFAHHDIAFLRQTSVSAHETYHATRVLGQAPLGPVATQGKIAVLHVDGNHVEEKAAEDLALWTPYLVAGAWLIVDDYGWAYGDGPKRATDAWLLHYHDCVAEHFVVDRAMFIKLH